MNLQLEAEGNNPLFSFSRSLAARVRLPRKDKLSIEAPLLWDVQVNSRKREFSRYIEGNAIVELVSRL